MAVEYDVFRIISCVVRKGLFQFLGFLCAATVSLPTQSYASENFYTIQTGTFTPSSLRNAKRQYDSLKKILNDSDLGYLRIEHGRKYYIVRIGKFAGIGEANKLLKTIRPHVADAFVLEDRDLESAKIVKLYDKPFPAPEQEKPKQEESKQEKLKPALEEYYTLQIGNFIKYEQAEEQFDMLSKTLLEKDLDNLRIEKAGNYFSVRLGKFENYASAREFLKRNNSGLSGVNILKGYIEDERIIRLYGATSLPEPLAPEKSLVEKEEEKKVPQKGSTPEKKESIESLFNDVSSQYYNQQYGKAAEILREGISKYPDNADLYAWYGATLLNMNIPDKAYEQYRKAAELSPDVADFHAGEGLSLLNGYMDRVKGSIEAFKKALAIDPHNVGALEGLGFVYTSIGKKNLATEIYHRLAPLDENAANRLSDAINNGINWEQNSSR